MIEYLDLLGYLKLDLGKILSAKKIVSEVYS